MNPAVDSPQSTASGAVRLARRLAVVNGKWGRASRPARRTGVSARSHPSPPARAIRTLSPRSRGDERGVFRGMRDEG